MKIHLKIAEGILDLAAIEYRSENLQSIAAIQQYAHGAFEVNISDDSAKLILECCRTWLDYAGTEGSNEYHHRLVKPLIDCEN